MPTFLTNPSTAVYLVLFAFALVTGALVARNQDRRSLIRFGIALAVLLAVYLMDKANESPYEEAVRRITAMAQAANARNPEAFGEHVADTVEYRGSEQPVRLTKRELRTSPFWGLLRQYRPRITVWDFAKSESTSDDTIELRFSGKGEPEGGGPMMLDFKATFRKQTDGSWKLIAITSYKYQSTEMLAIPNMGR